MQVAIVTGGAKGLGRNFCECLLKRGFKVHFCDINEKDGNKTAEELQQVYGEDKVKFTQCSVTDEEALKAFFSTVIKTDSAVDIMINNAGIVHETQWRKCIDVNLNGAIQGSMLAIEHMQQSNGGKGGIIINVSSMAGLFPVLYSPVYNATKSAIINFTRSWAANPRVFKNGIRMVSLCPSFVDTDILKSPSPEQLQGIEFLAPVMEKFGIIQPEQVGEALLRLIDETDNNGKVMAVTKEKTEYVTFPSPS